jgi:hypothetical protein
MRWHTSLISATREAETRDLHFKASQGTFRKPYLKNKIENKMAGCIAQVVENCLASVRP